MPDLELIDRGMRAQLRHFRDALDAGMPRLGWKLGITDPRVLERMGLESPATGWLRGDRAVPPGGRYEIRPGTRVALEAEVAVRVGGGGAVAAIAPAFEIVNYKSPGSTLEGILEHDLFHDAVAIGRDALPVPIAEDTWPHVRRNGEVVARRDPALLTLQPVAMVRHVAATLARYGETLETGDWIILGSLVAPLPLHAGDRIEADFGPVGRLAIDIAG
jgi:2-keto-4-pentenoate hydratase